MIYLDRGQVLDLIADAETSDNFITVRCIRKGKGDPDKGTAKGELHTLVCGPKPEYESKGTRTDRKTEDAALELRTVWAVNRDKTGGWRRLNMGQVVSVLYKEQEYKVSHG